MGKHLKTLIKEKPEGATHYDKGLGHYLDLSEVFSSWKKFDAAKGEWEETHFHSTGRHIVSLDARNLK